MLAPVHRVGVIGTGAMGGGVVQSVVRAGFAAIARDIRAEAQDLAVRHGAVPAASAADLARRRLHGARRKPAKREYRRRERQAPCGGPLRQWVGARIDRVSEPVGFAFAHTTEASPTDSLMTMEVLRRRL
jgi:hypothetical protein